MDAAGHVIREQSVASTPEAIATVIRAHGVPIERVGLEGVLLGLDHHPAAIADLGQQCFEGAEVDRAVARYGEHALDHALEELPFLSF